MAIKRDDLDAGGVDLSRVTTGRRLPPVHPGEILREEFLAPLGLSAYALAKAIRVPLNRVTAILAGRRAVTADTALRLARFFGTSATLWVNLQAQYDLDVARRAAEKTIARTIAPRAA
jgi:addiction module HigA family antidote